MSQESNPMNDNQIPAQPTPAGRDEVFDRIAAAPARDVHEVYEHLRALQMAEELKTACGWWRWQLPIPRILSATTLPRRAIAAGG